MKIGIDARCLIPEKLTGISTYLDRILSYWGKNNINDEFILYTWKPFEVERVYGKNFEIKIVEGEHTFLWMNFLMPWRIKKDRLDVFWGPNYQLPQKIKNVKYIVTIHDLALFIEPNWGTKRTANMIQRDVPKAAKRADAVLVISESTKRDVIRFLNEKGEKIFCTYLGGAEDKTELISYDTQKDIKKKYKITDKYFLFVGTIEPRKNIETLVKAFEEIAQKEKKVELIIAGGLGWNYDTVINTIEKSNYKSRIKHIGYITEEEKVNLFAGAEAFVFPSHYEGFGIPILEAFSLQTLVITANNSSLSEVGGKAAFYVDDEMNEKDLAKKMMNVLKLSEAERRKLIKIGVEQNNKFSWNKCAKQTLKIIKENTEYNI